MNKTVVLDMDGVLVDFEGEFCKEFGYERRELVALESRYPEHARKIVNFINDGFVYKRLKPIPLGLEIAAWLDDCGYDISVVTQRPFGFEGVSISWLKKNHVPFTTFKRSNPKVGHIAIMKPLCAVDDLYSVFQQLKGHNVPCLVMAHPWNQYSSENMPRFDNLGTFISEFNLVLEKNNGY